VQKKLDQWRALTGDERWLLAGLVVLLPVIGVALRLLGFRRTYRLLGGSGGSAAGHAEVGEDRQSMAMRLARLVHIASHHGPYTATCLRRSLALWWLLRRRGLPAQVRVGVGKDEDGVRAHAWVELMGRAINDRPAIAEEYAVFRDLDRRLPRSLQTAGLELITVVG